MSDPGTGGEHQERWFRQLDQQVRVLDRERQKFAAVVNQSDTYAFVTDVSRTIHWVNRAMNLRWPRDAETGGWIGKTCRDVCSQFDASLAPGACERCPVRRSLESNDAVHHEFRDACEGRARTLYLSALPIKGIDGLPQEVLVMMQDVSDLMTLRDSEERYRVVTQAASDGIVTIDEAGVVIFVNAAMERIFGYTTDELVGQPLTRLMPPQLAERHRVGFQRYLESGQRNIPWESLQLPAIRKGGREIIVEMSFGEYASNGKRLFTGIMRDITSRRQAELVLKQTQERLRVVVASSPIVLFAIDEAGMFTLSEGRGLEALGLKSGEVVGKSAFEVYSQAPRVIGNLRRALAGEQFTEVVDVGPLAFETCLSPLRDDSGRVIGVIGVATDVTDRRRLEGQLRQSQRMEAVGRLAGGVAHDFNNLLTTILGYSTLLLQRSDPETGPDARLAAIKLAAERAAGLTSQLLAFSRGQVVSPKVVDLNRVIAGMEEMLRRLTGEDVEFVFVLATRPAWVKADPGQLEQVLMNLAANARDAMPRGGRITIEVAHQRLEQPLVQGDVTVPPGECAVLSVRDTGCGMDRETLAHMFEPFFSNKDFSKGTGLGLAIVYGIVQQSGAHIVAESTPEGGSSLVIHFPITHEVPVVPEDRVVRATSQARAETLLLVEDEAAVRALALELLETEGYTVLEAANGNEALAIAERHSGPIHLCITDVVMPGMGGGELVTHLLAQRPDTRVLYFSGYTDDAIVRHGVSRVGAAFLQKPFTYEVFVATVRELLDGPPGTGGGRSGERDAA